MTSPALISVAAPALFAIGTSRFRDRRLVPPSSQFTPALATMNVRPLSTVASLLVLNLAMAAQARPLPTPQQLEALRQQGPAGLEQFLRQYGVKPDRPPAADLRASLDQLCQQRDCYASQLYWHTDLEQAKAAAKASGKPILSLRLLGGLDQDLSCANSRFFRVALYPNAAVSQYLRDRFILYWSSERPVPKVTIDFGDGRKLERTVTGNSIHYVLNADGQPIDAIPGLYGPQAFLKQLQQAEQAAQRYDRTPGEQQAEFLRNYHRDRLAALQAQWAADLTQLGIRNRPRLLELSGSLPPTDAATAGQIALTKMAVERPLVNAALSAATQNQAMLSDITDSDSWRKIATRYATEARLDRNSLTLMQRKLTPQSANSLDTVARQFETLMALDTVRNEYLLHSQIHQWFMQGRAIADWQTLNQRVYAELFLTPIADPWLGLLPQEGFAAIENNGLIP